MKMQRDMLYTECTYDSNRTKGNEVTNLLAGGCNDGHTYTLSFFSAV